MNFRPVEGHREVVGVVQRDRQLRELEVEVAWVVPTPSLERSTDSAKHARAQDRRQVAGLAKRGGPRPGILLRQGSALGVGRVPARKAS